MAKPEQCSHCTKPATIHLTQIVNNKIHKVDLCEDCPFKKGVTDTEGFSLADFILKPPVELLGESALRCETCGMTPADFKKTGRFGCPRCYETFSSLLLPMLRNMHKDVLHKGKVPSAALARIGLKRRLDQLHGDLKLAVEAENYEEAARLRDVISTVQASSDPF